MSDTRELYSRLVRLHVLRHAREEPVFGLWMIEERARRGYRLSPGTLYPLLSGMVRKGLLRSSRERVNGNVRRIYRAAPAGRAALRTAKKCVQQLLAELFEDHR
ncbi:MAG: PadR family transcriptional regulator [Candidatus Acidiferrales bacterium]